MRLQRNAPRFGGGAEFLLRNMIDKLENTGYHTEKS
jgi:hypothetical protein